MNKLATIRNDAGVTQEQVARVLGVSAKTPHNWEQLDDAKVKAYQVISYEHAVAEVVALIARYLLAA